MLRKNVSGQHLTLCLVNASTGAALTGATVTAYRSIDGAAQAAVTGTVTEKGNGQYDFAPSQADTNGDLIGYLFTATGAIPVNLAVRTTAADLANATSLGLTNLDAAVSSRSTYAGGDTSGTTTLLARLTAPRAANLDNLDTLVSGRASASVAPSWYTAPVDVSANVASIKAKTDQLVFTVAGTVDSNIQRVNDIVVTGTGAPGDEWGS